MRRVLLAAILTALFVAGMYLLFWPVASEPVAWTPPANPGRTGVFAANRGLAARDTLSLGQAFGPTAMIPDEDGHLYVSTISGHVLRVHAGSGDVDIIASTASPIVDLAFAPKRGLIIVDAVRGVFRLTIARRLEPLPTVIDAESMGLPSGVAVGRDGTLYISDASSRFAVQPGGDPLRSALLELIEHRGSGRIIALPPGDGPGHRAQVVASNLHLPCG